MEDPTDSEYLKQLVKEYDVVIPAINEQLQFYKREYAALKREVINLTKENELLCRKLEECASNHMELSPQSFRESDLVDNLKTQLNMSLKERESVVELWRTSMTRIDYLENELKIYSAGTDSVNKTLIRKMKKSYENEVKVLRGQLKDSQEKLLEAATLSKTSLETKKDELENLNKLLQVSQENMQKLESEIQEMRQKYSEVSRENDELKHVVELHKKEIENLRIDNYNAKLKVAEACHVIEAAFIEKDAAILREKEAVDEIQKLTSSINDIVQETESKIKSEIHNAREDFANKLHTYKLELKKNQENLSMKTLELEKRNEFCRQLEEEIEQLKEGKSKVLKNVTKEKQVWTGKVEENKEKLLTSERRNAQLRQQLKHLTNSLSSLKEKHDDELCNVEIQKKNLESQIHSLENELQLSNSRFQQVTSKVEDLSRRISCMDLQFKEELALKNTESERILTERLNEVECVNARINEELKGQLSAQITMHQKWKGEMRLMTEKLETRIRAMKTELNHLRSKNADLIQKLEHSECKRIEYKENLKTLCNEFNNLAHTKEH